MNKPNYNILTPFKRWTIQNFPFIEEDFDAITNYQLLCKIVEYLNKVIENEKLLEQSNNELIDAFNNLKSYVDNYFEELDVQNEINNKLDEMAESGELTDIIAQYLGLAGVLAFNTIDDMSDAQNITNGSICYCLGDNTYNDGKGGFYKIRTYTTGDVIDGFNIVALTVSETLIAERMPNYYIDLINNVINTINSNIITIENKITKLENKNNGIIGLTRIATNEAWNFVYSPNGIDFYPIGENTAPAVGDASSIIEINGIFYIVGSNRYKYSTDLINWSEEQFILEGYNANTYPRVWANTFAYDEINNIVYSYASYQYSDEDFPLPTYNYTSGHYPFKIIYQTGTINEDGSITFEQTTHDLLYDASESYYDPFVINDKIHGLVLACVKSSTLQVQIRTMSDFTSVTGSPITAPAIGVEAPQLITDNQGNIYCYVDCNWACTDRLINAGNSSPHINGFFTVAHTSGFYNSNQMRLIPYKWYVDSYFRHLGIMNASVKALKCAENIGIRIVPTHYGENSNLHNGRTWADATNDSVIINSPNVIWSIPASANVTVRTLFKNEPLIFKGAYAIGWKSDGDINDWCKNKHFTGQYSRQQIVVYPDSNNGIFDVPYTD